MIFYVVHYAILLATLVGTLFGQRLMMPNLGWLHQALSRASIVFGDLLVGEEWWQFLTRIRFNTLALSVALIFLGHSIAHLTQH